MTTYGHHCHWPQSTEMSAYSPIMERLLALHPKRIDLSLDRIWRILERLGHPERQLPPVIHVAGTNGKGSAVAFMRAMLEAAGRSVHVYTSPHLVRFNERYRLGAPGGGKLVGDAALAAVLEECERANGAEPITVFEIETAAAFLLFSRHSADLLLLEVGLGGRLDATNVIEKPLACAITSVALDHLEFLGDTLEKIAAEKAAILKPGVPAAIGRQSDEVLAVIEKQARRVRAPLRVAGEHWNVHEEGGRLVYQDEDGLLDLPRPKLVGRHQLDNAGVAIAALRAAGLGLPIAAFETGVTKAEWPARMQLLTHGKLKADTTRQRAVVGRRSQRRRRPRHRGGVGRSRRTCVAPADFDRRHAGDQGRNGLFAEFYRPGARICCRADPASGKKHTGGGAD